MAYAGLAVARRAVKKQAPSGGYGQSGDLDNVVRKDQLLEGLDCMFGRDDREVFKLPFQALNVRLQGDRGGADIARYFKSLVHWPRFAQDLQQFVRSQFFK